MLRRLAPVASVAAALAAASQAVAATPTVTAPTYDVHGRLIDLPFARTEQSNLTKERATAALLAFPKVADWLRRYPEKGRITDADYDSKTKAWTVKVWWGAAGEIALGKVSDATGLVTEAWTGPQVAWKMARGYPGGFGGKKINTPWVWLTFCAIFLAGLADWRRPRSLRNLDLVALLFFTIPLWYFNHGDVFTSMSLVYPPLVYLLGRAVWIGVRGRATRTGRPVWPIWLL